MPKNELVKGIDLQVSQVTFAPAGATSGGVSDMEVHALDSVWHTGTLPWSSLDLSAADLADIATRPHSALTGIGANDHHNQSHVLATNAALGADHTISGATSGHVLRASSATAAAFAAIADADLPSTIVRTNALGGASVLDQTLKDWTESTAYELTAATRNSDDIITTATAKWPDGSAGTFTATTINSTWYGIDAYTVSHADSSKTVTQTAVTRNATGGVTAKPALTVA